MRIAIDPNVRTKGNETFSGFGDVFGDVETLNPGDWVTVMCEETDVIGDAKVSCIDFERKHIYLAVDWSSLRDDVPPAVIGSVTFTAGGRTRRLPLGEVLDVTILAGESRCGSRYDGAREDDDTYCVCTKSSGHDGRHVCTCDERWTDDQAAAAG
jgi:hypothetical protein